MSSSDADRVGPPIAWGHATVILATAFVVLRFVSRGYILGVLGPTDWLIAFSLLLSLAYTVFMIIQIRTGYGLHIWDITPEQLRVYFQMVYATLILFSAAVIATKVSILLLLLSIFNSTCLRRVTYAVFAAVLIHGGWIIFSNVFFCNPVHAFWDFDLPRDRCFSLQKWFIEMWAHIALDFAIFVLPISVIRSMTLPRRQKFWLYFVFSLGFIVCVVAAVRLYYMYKAVHSDDPTYDSMVLIILCFVELNLSIAIPCLITLKPLIDRLLPSLLVRKASLDRLGLDGSPAEQSDSNHPPTISSPLPRGPPRDREMEEV